MGFKFASREDFKDIGNLSNACNLPKLEVAIKKALDFDLGQIFCEDWVQIKEIWEEIDNFRECAKDGRFSSDFGDDFLHCKEPENMEFKDKLIFGGQFTNCAGKKREQAGLKRALCYYAYARYVLDNPYTDTAVGGRIKDSDFSIPIPRKELEDISDEYRNMGLAILKGVIDFICSDNIYCFSVECNCGCEACNNEPVGVRSWRGSIIRKR